MGLSIAAIVAYGREVSVPALVLASIVANGPAGIVSTGSASSLDHTSFIGAARDVGLSTQGETTDTAPRSIEMTVNDPAFSSLDLTPIAETTMSVPTETPIETPTIDNSQKILASTGTPAQDDEVAPANIVPAVKQCPEHACVDAYLWALYEKTPKQDAITVRETRQVIVKKRGRTVTVTRTFTRSKDEDFSWKDPEAAEKVGKSMKDYVIGGMDSDFKARLFNLLSAAEQAGLSPGITSAFRDDYRQSIASGMKAATNRSYHGGSLRGGYGHGVAADIVSVKGATRAERMASSQSFWSWVDVHGNEFGIGRPYLDKDPPHVGPLDGKEYADHHPAPKTRPTVTSSRSDKAVALRSSAAARHLKPVRQTT